MCWKPIYVKSRESYFPCGKCPKCIARKVSAWSFRLQQEEKVSTSAVFATLTYNNDHVPIKDGKLILQKSDLQNMFKRLRHKLDKKISYYAVGEYGGRTKRPHYHALIFNASADLINDAWKLDGEEIGTTFFGNVTGASIGYTLKYMSKNRKWHKKYDLTPEFAIMSKGIGVNYIKDLRNINWHKSDLEKRMYCTTYDGIKLSMPRYYKDKLYTDEERKKISEYQSELINKKNLEKIMKQDYIEIINYQKAIDAAFDRMYLSSLKTAI